MRMILRFTSFLILVLSLSFSATSKPLKPLVLEPALWEITHHGSVSYLFGSIHIGKQSWYPLPITVQNAFEQTSSLVVELNTISRGAQVQQAMVLPPGKSLAQFISPDTFNKLKVYAADYGVPLAVFESMKPWAAATVVSILPYMQQGLTPQFGIDMHFINAATRLNKPIVELETVAFQLGMLEQVFKDEAAFIEVLEMPKADATTMVDYWIRGDMAQLERLTLEQMTEQQRDLILLKRNHDWVVKLKKILASNTHHFVVVGAAHLAGDNGIPALLVAQGITVKRVVFP